MCADRVRPQSVRGKHLRLALRWPRRSPHLLPEPHRSFRPAHTQRVAFPSCRHGRTNPRNARSSQPSPGRIFSVSGPANRWTPLSSRPCLPDCRRNYKQQGPFAPRTLLRFIANTDPSATLSPSIDFPVSSVIRSTLLRLFLAGTRRASPVAWHVLVTVLSLPPRRDRDAASVRFRHPMLPSPFSCGLGPRIHSLSRPLSRSLSLRPGDS